MLAALLLLAMQDDPAAALHQAREARDYAAGLGAAVAMREAGSNPWENEDFVGLLNDCVDNGTPDQKAELFSGTIDAFPEETRARREVLWCASMNCAVTGRRPDDAAAWMEAVVDEADRLRQAAEGAGRERLDAEWSEWRAYLAYVYRRVGREDNRLRREEAEPGARFEETTDAAGLAGAPGKRVAAGDFDDDGFDDLLFRGQLYRNRRDGTFEDVTAAVGLPGAAGSSAVWVDLDGDGRLDAVLANEAGVHVYLQNAQHAFEDATSRSAFAAFASPPEGLAAGDLDGDGRADLYVALYEMSGEPLARGVADHVYRNLGEGRFEDATDAWGFAQPEPRCGRGVAMADFDDDGDLDVYVANYRLNPNFLWRNTGGGHFEEVSRMLGVEGTETQGAYGHSIGAVWGDIDGDARLDLIVGNLAHPRFIEFSDRTYVYRNTGGHFEDRFPESGIAYEETHSDVSLADYDNDGDLDLYITSIYAERPSFLYQNDGTGHFAPVTWGAGVVVFDGWGHAWLDYDNDGDLDLVVCGDRVRLFRNGGNGNAWVRIRLPAGAVGARVSVTAGDGRLVREIAAGRGTSSQDSAVLHFGLGPRNEPVSAEIRWPDGRTAQRPRLSVNRVYPIER